jgi:hypothetical protein
LGLSCLPCLSGLSLFHRSHKFPLTSIHQPEISCNGWLHLECSFSLYFYLIKISAIKMSNITPPHKTNICYFKFTYIINCSNKYTDKTYTKA